MFKVTSYKGWKIKQVQEDVFLVFTDDEWGYGEYLRNPEHDACTLAEAKEFINSYNKGESK